MMTLTITEEKRLALTETSCFDDKQTSILNWIAAAALHVKNKTKLQSFLCHSTMAAILNRVLSVSLKPILRFMKYFAIEKNNKETQVCTHTRLYNEIDHVKSKKKILEPKSP